ncbi:MAG: zinc-binding alcohol dehydrogenase family protein [Gordonia amarae]
MTHADSQSTTPIAGSVRAALVDAPGTPPHIGHARLPHRAPGQTLIEVHAAPLNPLDIGIAAGLVPTARFSDPFVPGIECAGTVVESDTMLQGTLVYAETHPSPAQPGTFATHVIVSDEAVTAVPAGLDAASAVAVGNSGVAAYLPLIDVAGLHPGDNVLILGATGVLGRIATQIALTHGAASVVAVGRDETALNKLRALGAVPVALREAEAAAELAGRLTEAGPPADVVLDAVYGTALQAAIIAAANGARIINVGNASGAVTEILAPALRLKQLTLSGFASFLTPVSEKTAALHWLWEQLRTDRLRIDIDVRALDDLPEAWTDQQDSPHAKIVLDPRL